MKIRHLIFVAIAVLFAVVPKLLFAQSTSLCDANMMNASPFCTDLNPYGISYSAGTTGYANELYYLNTTGCLDPYTGGVYPVWYKMKISAPGTLNIYMSHSGNCDIDYACWGPFSDQDMEDMCSGYPYSLANYLYDNLPYNVYYDEYYTYGEQWFSHHPNYVDNNYTSATYGMSWLTDWYTTPSGKLVDCSATPSPTEWVHIRNAQVGQWYILLISNWEGCAGTINFMRDASSTAQTDCSITAPVAGDEVCEGETATLTADIASGAVHYRWTAPNGTTQITTGNSLTISNVTMADAGEYTLEVYNGGSYGNPTTCQLIVHPKPVIAVSDVTICRNGTATITASGADTYAWNTGATTAYVTVSPLTTTVYTVTGTNAGMCVSTATVTVTVIDSLILTIAPDTICVGETATVSGPNNLSYVWSNGTEGASITPTSANPSVYTVLGTTPDGCTGTASVYVMPAPTAGFTADAWTVSWENSTITFTDQSADATSWSWDFGCPTDPNNISTEQNPSFTYPYPGYFGVTLTVTSANGCVDRSMHQVTVEGEEYQLFIPSAFSPNDNGVNEKWRAYGFGVISYDCVVYDRWGRIVFWTDNMEEEWDGTAYGVALQADSYAYGIKVTFMNHEDVQYRGTVTILR